jgi:hypothetical protein
VQQSAFVSQPLPVDRHGLHRFPSRTEHVSPAQHSPIAVQPLPTAVQVPGATHEVPLQVPLQQSDPPVHAAPLKPHAAHCPLLQAFAAHVPLAQGMIFPASRPPSAPPSAWVASAYVTSPPATSCVASAVSPSRAASDSTPASTRGASRIASSSEGASSEHAEASSVATTPTRAPPHTTPR